MERIGIPLIQRSEDWVPELASILPLSALLDFLDATRVLHNLQLTGVTAWWCWPITPASSRMLLSMSTTDETCLRDRFDASTTPTCLDGRYGDRYSMASPETLRLCLGTVQPQTIENTHANMSREDIRVHKITLVHVSRQRVQVTRDWIGLLAKIFGWLLLSIMVAFSISSGSWLLLAFLSFVTASGLVVSRTFLSGPRLLRVDKGSGYNRLVLSAQHMNATDWEIYYGESSLVNSLLNWPLRLDDPKSASSLTKTAWLIWLLRILILGQWATTIGAAALKGWDAYGISFWIIFCIGMNVTCFGTERSAWFWLRGSSVKLDRFIVRVSSRRALLNTVLALNPDTFLWDDRTEKDLVDRFMPNATSWIDDILKAGESRSQWEDASRIAMAAAMNKGDLGPVASSITYEKLLDLNEMAELERTRTLYTKQYWFKYIEEGMQVADKVKEQAGLSGRFSKKVER